MHFPQTAPTQSTFDSAMKHVFSKAKTDVNMLRIMFPALYKFTIAFDSKNLLNLPSFIKVSEDFHKNIVASEKQKPQG
jgi:hypothetical protein